MNHPITKRHTGDRFVLSFDRLCAVITRRCHDELGTLEAATVDFQLGPFQMLRLNLDSAVSRFSLFIAAREKYGSRKSAQRAQQVKQNTALIFRSKQFIYDGRFRNVFTIYA